MAVTLIFIIYAYSGYFAAEYPDKVVILSILLPLTLGITVAFRNSLKALDVAVLCISFTQVPTAKIFFRWRITEIIAWLLAPTNLKRVLRGFKNFPRLTRLYIFMMALYFLYTFLIGIIAAPMIAPHVEQALEYTHHPFLRTTLESARCLAIISLMIGIVFTLNSHQDLNRYLELFIIGGTLTSLYGLYQTLVLRYSLSLALIPETLHHENSTRPFSTFYEPTGLGSYTAASTLLALYFIYTKRRVGRVFWILNFGLNVMGLWLSLSRAGLMGLGSGILILAIILSITFKVKRLFSGLIISFLVFYILYFAVRYILSDTMDFGLSFFWWQQSMKERQESYGQLLSLLGAYPTGVGQGNFLFIGAGAPGFARLLVEGGLLGLILLLMMHSYALLCLTSILRSRLHYFRQIGPYIAAAYISCLITTANYISTTDSWIWFIWSLPAFACTLERKAIEDPFKAPSDSDIPAAARPPAW